MNEEFFDTTFKVNVKSVVFFCKDALELLKKGKDANILVTSSLSALHPSRFLGVYAMGKAAIVNMVQWLSLELMDYNIRVNAIGPGVTKTPMIQRDWDLGLGELIPPKALADPSEIASVAAMICSKDGSFINGETYILSGGFPKL